MKKIFTFAVSALMASAAWAGVITLDLNKPLNPSTLEYNDYGIWTGCYNDVDYTWLEFGDENGEFLLSHLPRGVATIGTDSAPLSVEIRPTMVNPVAVAPGPPILAVAWLVVAVSSTMAR